MIDVQSSKSCRWMIGECLKLNIQLDIRRYPMIWSLWKWCWRAECDKNTTMNESHLTDCEMNQSRSEAKRQATVQFLHPMTNISAFLHYWTNTRTLICLCKISMWILYNKKATLYTYTRNSNGVSSYWSTWTTFACNIQPLNTKDWIEWADFLKMRKLYSDKVLTVWDKVVCDWITYIVDRTENRDWAKRKFCKSFIIESNWN